MYRIFYYPFSRATSIFVRYKFWQQSCIIRSVSHPFNKTKADKCDYWETFRALYAQWYNSYLFLHAYIHVDYNLLCIDTFLQDRIVHLHKYHNFIF